MNTPQPKGLHDTWCSHCPGENILKEGKQTGRYRYHPEKCRYCSPESFTDKLSAYFNLEHDLKEFRRKREAAQKGMVFSGSRQRELYDELKNHCEKGQTRVITLGSVSAVLDWTGDNLRILFAQVERQPVC